MIYHGNELEGLYKLITKLCILFKLPHNLKGIENHKLHENHSKFRKTTATNEDIKTLNSGPPSHGIESLHTTSNVSTIHHLSSTPIIIIEVMVDSKYCCQIAMIAASYHLNNTNTRHHKTLNTLSHINILQYFPSSQSQRTYHSTIILSSDLHHHTLRLHEDQVGHPRSMQTNQQICLTIQFHFTG